MGINWLKNLLGYSFCPLCGRFNNNGLCSHCLELLDRAIEEKQRVECCCYCGRPLISERESCCDCRKEMEKNPHLFFPKGQTLFEYFGEGKEVMGAYKFKNERLFGEIFAERTIDFIRFSPQQWVFVPIPGNRRNVRRRGWDPVGLFLHHLALKGFEVSELFYRRAHTPSLKKLTREQRRQSALGCYGLKTGVNVPKRIVLVDDVRTTGSTLSHCGSLLKAAGAQEVVFFALGGAP